MLYKLFLFSLALIVVGGTWLQSLAWRDGRYWKGRLRYIHENWAENKIPFIIWAVGTVILISCLILKVLVIKV